MKSLRNDTVDGRPFKSRFFTETVLTHILNEGFKWRDDNDSYTSNSEFCGYDNRDNKGCYKKYEDGNGTDLYIYICENGIEIDQDYDCGGNMNTKFIEFDESYEFGDEAFEEAYDKMVDYVNSRKN